VGAIRLVFNEAQTLAAEARALAATGNLQEAQDKLEQAAARISDVSDVSNDLIGEGTMLHVLASVGTQFAGFVHEINALLGSAETIERALGELRQAGNLDRVTKSRLAHIHRATGDLRRQLERQASYLIDVVSPDARRRRSRQSLAERFDAASRLVAHIAERRGILIKNTIPPALKSPPMFPAELTAIFSNLLTNAVKAAGADGRVLASASEQDSAVTLRIENTGTPVVPGEGEKWFRPFESSTTEIDAVLGQGMGLGLPITRTILEEYGAEISFAPPSKGFATSLSITFPGR
jgi:signal transduction histidine kinase